MSSSLQLTYHNICTFLFNIYCTYLSITLYRDTKVFEKCTVNHGKGRQLCKQNNKEHGHHEPRHLCKCNRERELQIIDGVNDFFYVPDTCITSYFLQCFVPFLSLNRNSSLHDTDCCEIK